MEARSVQEILAHLGLKDRKNIMVYINRLLEQGRIARTILDKPNSSNQNILQSNKEVVIWVKNSIYRE